MVTSVEGCAGLLSRIYGVPVEDVRKEFCVPMPAPYGRCYCGRPLRYWGCVTCSVECSHSLHVVPQYCEVCGALTEVKLSQMRFRQTDDRYHGHIFCGKKCQGKWLAENYGFPAHPENRVHEVHPARSYDWEQVWKLYLRLGTAYGVAKALGYGYGPVRRMLREMLGEPLEIRYIPHRLDWDLVWEVCQEVGSPYRVAKLLGMSESSAYYIVRKMEGRR